MVRERQSLPGLSLPSSPPVVLAHRKSRPAANSDLKRKRTEEAVDGAIDWYSASRSKELKGGFRAVYSAPGPAAKPLKGNKKQKSKPKSKPGKGTEEGPEDVQIQSSPFEYGTLSDVRYSVEPRRYWEAAPFYRKCSIKDELVNVGDYVYVKGANDGSSHALVQAWVAKVLEIRAGDPEHIYMRVYWMYRPEDLPKGRQPYHGQNELIASNDMDVIEAQTIQCKADTLDYWNEDTDQAPPNVDLYWRQTLDVSNGQNKLSEPRKYCIDKRPTNPDEPLVHCDNCDIWLHGPCLEEDALSRVYKTHGFDYQTELEAAKKWRPSAKQKTPPKPLFTATVNTKLKVTIKDRRKGQGKHIWEIPVKCLKCKTPIDSDTNDSPQSSNAAATEDAPDEVNGDAANSSKENEAPAPTSPLFEPVEETRRAAASSGSSSSSGDDEVAEATQTISVTRLQKPDGALDEQIETETTELVRKSGTPAKIYGRLSGFFRPRVE